MDIFKKKAQELKDKISKTTPLERLLLDATNNDNWSTPPKILSEIADATFSYQDFNTVMKFIWERLQTQKHKSWRKTYKVLYIIDYLLKNGAPRCITEFKDEIYQIRSLKDYCMFEENQDKGEGVREKVKQVIELLEDEKRLDDERQVAKNIREAMMKHGDNFSNKMGGVGGSSKYGSYGSNQAQSGGSSSYAGYNSKTKPSQSRNGDDDFSYGGRNYDDFSGGTLAKFRQKEEEKKKEQEKLKVQEVSKPAVASNISSSNQFEEPKKAFQKSVPMLSKPGEKPRPIQNNEQPTQQQASNQGDLFDILADNSNQAEQKPVQQAQQQQSKVRNDDDDFDWGEVQTGHQQPKPQQQQQQNIYQQQQNNNNFDDFGWDNQKTQNNQNQNQGQNNLYQLQQNHNNNNQQGNNQQQQFQQQQFKAPQQQQQNNNQNLFDDDFFGPSTGNNNQQQQNQNPYQNHPNVLNMKSGEFMQQQAKGIPSINKNVSNQQNNNNNNNDDDFDDFVNAGNPENKKDKIFKNYNETEKALIDLSDLTLEDKKNKAQQQQQSNQAGGLYSTKEDLDTFGQNRQSGNPYAPKPINFSSLYNNGSNSSQNNYNAFNNVNQQQQQQQQQQWGGNQMGMNQGNMRQQQQWGMGNQGNMRGMNQGNMGMGMQGNMGMGMQGNMGMGMQGNMGGMNQGGMGMGMNQGYGMNQNKNNPF